MLTRAMNHPDRMPTWILIGALQILFLAGLESTRVAVADQPERPTDKEVEYFERHVRPLLATHCYKCHGEQAGKSPKGGLRLDGRAALLAGGDSGTALVAGKPDESLLIQAVRYEAYEMPPQGKLSEDQISILVRWVEMGAPWPNDKTPLATRAGESYDWSTVRASHWAWQPVQRPKLPPVDDLTWPQQPLDQFVLSRLAAAGLTAAPQADRRTLIRRAYFDLTGLPPAPAAVEAFVRDPNPHAFASVIDQLLGSAQYGERWGRHWLDVARYSDGLGGFLDNAQLPHAYRFRDWVIRSFNQDLPYDTFVRHQIAGDLLDDDEAFYGSGFFAIGPTYRSDGGDPDSVAQAKSETLDDRVDTLSRAFFGLTVACARCHDHKFDPIPTQDYYSLAGVFNNTQSIERPLVPQEVVDQYNQAQKQLGDHNNRLKNREKELKKDGRQPTPEEEQELATLRAEIEVLKKNGSPKYPVTHALTDSGQQDMKIALRGNLRKPGEVAPRRFLKILAGDDRKPYTRGSGRIELAESVVDPRNPLTARVMVNRIWLQHFGRALVRSPSNFGKLGEQPTHPQLLDWLAVEFVENGWSIKQLHRTIMLSATYQMSSRYHPDHFRRDGDNRLIWRMNPRRLEVEAWRDALLAVGNGLDQTMGGGPTSNLHQSRRRTLYSIVSRNGDRFESDEFLRLFDFPSPRATSAARVTSTVPQQFLFMLNSPFMIDRSRELARRLAVDASNEEGRIDRAYRLLFSRPPTAREVKLGQQFLKQAAEPLATTTSANQVQLSPWQQYAQILLSANEFMQLR